MDECFMLFIEIILLIYILIIAFVQVQTYVNSDSTREKPFSQKETTKKRKSNSAPMSALKIIKSDEFILDSGDEECWPSLGKVGGATTKPEKPVCVGVDLNLPRLSYSFYGAGCTEGKLLAVPNIPAKLIRL